MSRKVVENVTFQSELNFVDIESKGVSVSYKILVGLFICKTI